MQNVDVGAKILHRILVPQFIWIPKADSVRFEKGAPSKYHQRLGPTLQDPARYLGTYRM